METGTNGKGLTRRDALRALFAGAVATTGLLVACDRSPTLGPPPEPTPAATPEASDAPEPAAPLPKHKCSVCGYEYDPAKGAPERKTPAGTAFGDLPDDWTCPRCKAAKDKFAVVPD